MKITAQEEYGIRCLTQLARHSGKLTISEIAGAEGLTVENAAKILARLRVLGLVRSIRGKEGGYVLARPAHEINVAQVVEGMTGAIFETERCAGEEHSEGCVHHGECGLRPIWNSLNHLVHTFLGAISLADLVATEELEVHRLTERIAHRLSHPVTVPHRLPHAVPDSAAGTH